MVLLRPFLSLTSGLLLVIHHSLAANVVDLHHSLKRDTQSAPSANTALLRPAIDSQINIYDYNTLTPTRSHRFYYATIENGRAHQAWVNYAFTLPLVALDHTAYISQLRCFGPGGTHMIVQLNKKKAYNMALSWRTQMPMILSGYWHDNCKPADKGADRYFAYATKLEKHSGHYELKFTVRFMTIAEVAHDMEINIGHPSGISAPKTATSTAHPTSIIQAPHATTPVPTSVPTQTINYVPPVLPTPVTPDTTLEDFDVALDERIGYWTGFGDAFMQQVFPGQSSVSARDFDERDLEERGILSDAKAKAEAAAKAAAAKAKAAAQAAAQAAAAKAQAAAQAAADKAKAAAKNPSSINPAALVRQGIAAAKTAVAQAAKLPALGPLIQTAATAVKSVAVAAVKTIAAAIPPVSLTPINTDWSWTLPPRGVLPGVVQSPFGDGSAIKFYEYQRSATRAQARGSVAAYCVNCQVNGTFHITGTLKANPAAFSVTQAQIAISGPMQLNTEVGFIFSGGVAINFKKEMYNVPIAQFKIPSIIEIGPKFTLAMQAALSAQADGQISFGQTAVWDPNFAITLDLLHPLSSSVVHYNHQLKPFVNMHGQFSMSMSGNAMVGVPITANLLNGKFKYEAGLWAAAGTSTTLQASFDKTIGKTRREIQMLEAALGIDGSYDVDTLHIRDDADADASTSSNLSADSSSTSSTDVQAAAQAQVAADPVAACNGVFVGMNGYKGVWFEAPLIGTKTFWGTTSTLGHWCQTTPGTPKSTSAPALTTTPASTPTPTSTPHSDPASTNATLTPTSVPSDSGGAPTTAPTSVATTSAPVSQATPPAAVSTPAPTTSCQGVPNGAYTVANGAQYNVACGADYPGSDIAWPPVRSFAQCVSACEHYNANSPRAVCRGVSWVPSRLGTVDPPCYLKGAITGPITQSFEVDSAVLVSGGTTCQGKAQAPYVADGVQYDVKCSVDLPGADVATPNVYSFGACIDACNDFNDQNGSGACVSVSWVPSRLGSTPCYLKNAVPGATLRDFEVDSAIVHTSISAYVPPTPVQQGPCVPTASAVPFLRAYGPQKDDHFFTPYPAEMQNAISSLGYQPEANAARVFTSPGGALVPFHRVNFHPQEDHMYLTDTAELQRSLDYGASNEGVPAYVYADGSCPGTVPLYRLYRRKADDPSWFVHFMTTDEAERDRAINTFGYILDFIVGYVLPA